jgi:hypothetical protein
MCPQQEIELTLSIDLRAEPVTGSLTTPSGDCQRFRGWIALSAALERIRAGELHAPDRPAGA